MGIKYHYYQLFFEYPIIKQLALSRLKEAIDNYLLNNFPHLAYSISTSYRANECCEVLYISNVAFIFSKILNHPPLEVAKSFASFYLSQDFILKVVPPGFLQLKLTQPKLASWLQCLPFLPLLLPSLVFPKKFICLKNNSSLFAIQYAHARCYSLMQLAEKEGLITLAEISAPQIKSLFPDLAISSEVSVLTINYPQPLNWLNTDQQLLFCHQAEYALITQLVKAVDDFGCSPKLKLDYWAKVAFNLSQAFADFYSHCRIFSLESPLAQARLGLILATYTVLKLLLQRLGQFAPQEL